MTLNFLFACLYTSIAKFLVVCHQIKFYVVLDLKPQDITHDRQALLQLSYFEHSLWFLSSWLCFSFSLHSLQPSLSPKFAMLLSLVSKYNLQFPQISKNVSLSKIICLDARYAILTWFLYVGNIMSNKEEQ